MEFLSDEDETTDLDLSRESQRLYVVNMLTVYQHAALANYAEAEELIIRALELREAGHVILERASQLAFQQGLDDAVETLRTEDLDPIPW